MLNRYRRLLLLLIRDAESLGTVTPVDDTQRRCAGVDRVRGGRLIGLAELKC